MRQDVARLPAFHPRTRSRFALRQFDIDVGTVALWSPVAGQDLSPVLLLRACHDPPPPNVRRCARALLPPICPSAASRVRVGVSSSVCHVRVHGRPWCSASLSWPAPRVCMKSAERRHVCWCMLMSARINRERRGRELKERTEEEEKEEEPEKQPALREAHGPLARSQHKNISV